MEYQLTAKSREILKSYPPQEMAQCLCAAALRLVETFDPVDTESLRRTVYEMQCEALFVSDFLQTLKKKKLAGLHTPENADHGHSPGVPLSASVLCGCRFYTAVPKKNV